MDDARIQSIIQQVTAELRQGERVRHGPPIEPQVRAGPPPAADLSFCGGPRARASRPPGT